MPKKIKKEEGAAFSQSDLDQICRLRVSAFDRHNPGQSAQFLSGTSQSPSRNSISFSIPAKPILIVSDNYKKRNHLARSLSQTQHQVLQCASESFLFVVQEKEVDFSLLIIDTDTLPESTYRHSEYIRYAYQSTPVIFVGKGHVEKLKRTDYPEYLVGVLPEFDSVTLLPLVNSGLRISKTIQEKNWFDISMGIPVSMFNFTYFKNCEPLQRLVKDIIVAASQDGPVFIEAEPEIHKDLIATQIHFHSSRSREPFDIFSSHSISLPEFYEPTLFGLEKNTSSLFPEGRIGKLEMLNHGTILIDEIDNMHIPAQERLLACLKNKSLFRINAARPIPNNTRILASGSPTRLKKWLEIGAFSRELYDILTRTTVRAPFFVDYIETGLEEWITVCTEWICESIDQTPPRFTKAAVEKMMKFRWPKTLREFIRFMRYIVYSNASGVVDEKDIDFHFMTRSTTETLSPFIGLSYEEMSRRFILETLHSQGGNRSATARILGISEKTLYNKLRLYDKQDSTEPPIDESL